MSDYWDIDSIVTRLATVRQSWRSAQKRHGEFGEDSFPSRGDIGKIMEALCGALFPMRLGPSFVRPHNEDAYVAQTLQTALSRLYGQIRRELIYAAQSISHEAIDQRASDIIADFAQALPDLRRMLDSDVEAAYHGDPAAYSVDEVLICYPSMLAIIHHRLAHHLHGLGARLVARIISERAHSKTGIDIHPGAKIEEGFFMDHGTGVVIGETAIIGKRVRLYQGVTLGARSLPLGPNGVAGRGERRHPTVEDDVVIYAGATLLGRITIGRGSEIGGNVWLTQTVPAGSRITQAHAENRIRPAVPEEV
ncbi:MAG: serine acetyltransferase [Sphingobium sp.]|nr:serine acetyltransferase [Sphingobium sp.]